MQNPPDQQTQFYRTIFLSDFHIGAKTFNADALLDFLRRTESSTLYLVGDIIDGWKLRKRWYWTETVSEIFDELFRKAHEGTKIVYITGNHDETVRTLSLITRMRYARRLNIQIKNRVVHKMADGRDFLVLHGDQFDRALLRGRVSQWGDRIYDYFATRFQKDAGPMINIEGVPKRFSLSKFLAYHGQIALNILNNFENALAREARHSDVHGIICGHTHIAAHKTIGAVTYANCGAWLKNTSTAIVENAAGKIELIDWPQGILQLRPTNASRFRPMTNRLIGSIRRTWPSPHNASAPEKQFVSAPALSQA